MQLKQERFIILKKIKYGEADLIIHALGTDGAKCSFIAKSALRSKKRFGGGVLEPLHFVNFTYQDAKSEGQIRKLNEAILIDDFKEIRNSYEKLELGLFIINCVSHVSLEGDQNSEFLFNLTGHALRALTKCEDIKTLKMHFCLKFLYQQGVISVEPWMSIFLKTNLSDNQAFIADENIKLIVDEYLIGIEQMVLQYIKTADSGVI